LTLTETHAACVSVTYLLMMETGYARTTHS